MGGILVLRKLSAKGGEFEDERVGNGKSWGWWGFRHGLLIASGGL